MAAVFPPPPPDPYQGLEGLDRAWARWRDWIMVDLPRQWNEFMGLVSALGGTGGGGGPPPPPPPPPVPVYEHYPIPDWLTMDKLSPEDQGRAQGYILTWPLAVTSGGRVMPSFYSLSSTVATPELVAMALLQWWGYNTGFGWRILPWDDPMRTSGRVIWFPGMPL